MGEHSLLIWLHFSLSLIVLCSPSEINSRISYQLCGNGSTYTASSTFHDNLDHLMHIGHDTGDSNLGFDSTSVGDPPNEAYGLFSCRQDISPSDCQSCIGGVSSHIVERCPAQKNAIVWVDECFIRYSDRNFSPIIISIHNVTLLSMPYPADQVISKETILNKFLGLIYDVVLHPSNMMEGTTSFSLPSSSGTLSIECIPGLANMDCTSCLTYASYQIPMESIQAEVRLPNCSLKYEIRRSSNQVRGQDPASPPDDSSSNNRTNSETTPQPSHNPTNNGTIPTNPDRSRWIIIVSSTGGAAACLVVSLASYFIYALRKMKSKKGCNNQEIQLHDLKTEADEFPYDYFHEEKPLNSRDLPLMRLEVISAATNNFSFKNKLGQGGFGPVYKGILGDGKEIAVKRLSGTSGQGLSELRTEVTLIARLQHRNLVRLLGCCLENNEKLLIYEYMPNKSLDVFLFGSNTGMSLDWERRQNIIDGIARGLLYLHEDSRLRIVHRDLKASNILLDHDMNPKISDFGMARIVGGNQTGDTTNRVVGTYGYMAPEYAMEGLFSVKSDVFSFGVLLLELLSGKRNNGFHLHQHGESLLTYAWRLWGEGRGLELIDQRIRESFNAVQALKCIHIGLLCVQEEPADRPNMLVVVLMLRGDTVSLPRPAKPAFSVGRHTVDLDAPQSHKAFSSVNGVTISSMSPR